MLWVGMDNGVRAVHACCAAARDAEPRQAGHRWPLAGQLQGASLTASHLRREAPHLDVPAHGQAKSAAVHGGGTHGGPRLKNSQAHLREAERGVQGQGWKVLGAGTGHLTAGSSSSSSAGSRAARCTSTISSRRWQGITVGGRGQATRQQLLLRMSHLGREGLVVQLRRRLQRHLQRQVEAAVEGLAHGGVGPVVQAAHNLQGCRWARAGGCGQQGRREGVGRQADMNRMRWATMWARCG